MEHDSTVYVGLDVHKESITIAYAVGMGDVELLGRIGTAKGDIDRLCKRLHSKGRRVHVVYEAGPCGYGLYRQLVAEGFECMVCAPSLIPKKPGERVKTDRRDSIKLARALRAGDLSAVHVSGIEDEAFRDLARAWVSAKDDLKQARQRLKSFLLSHGVRYPGKADWGSSYRRWEVNIRSATNGNNWHSKNIAVLLGTAWRNASALKRLCATRWSTGGSILRSWDCRQCVVSSSPRLSGCSPKWAISLASSTRDN